ncbi:ROK family protein [Consotaella aegiceratis]|uniref:ROK family protein n=1 Tax=Consotaella aegiceratis TaxID=3097961 RepID=UPI002F42F1D2
MNSAIGTPLLCFDIGGSFIKFGLCERPGVVAQAGRRTTPATSWTGFVDALSATVAAHVDQIAPSTPLSISTAGMIDAETGLVTAASNVPCLVGHRPAAELSEILGRPVLVANDADCFALAEAEIGAGHGRRVVFGVILGTGVGGGLVIDGRLVASAGEWGHGPITKTQLANGTVDLPRLPCACGQVGCLDVLGAARGLERIHAHLFGGAKDSRVIIEEWLAGDEQAARAVAIQIELISEPLAVVVNATSASIVPVGGGLGSVAPFVAALDAAVRPLILRHTDQPLVVPAQTSADAGLIGAGVLGHQAAGRTTHHDKV